MKKAPPLILLCAAASAHAAPGSVVFTRGGSVYQQPADGTGAPVRIAALPDDATEVRWAEATRDGRLIVLDFGNYASWLWAESPELPAALRGGGCTGRARPAPAGEWVICPGREGTMLVATQCEFSGRLPIGLDDASFSGPSGFTLAGRTADGIMGVDRRDATEAKRLAKSGAVSNFLVAPNGVNAVAVFGTGDAGRIRSFLLDGEGASRQLGGPGIPTLWSWDSSWVLFQEGDIKNAPAPASPGDEGRLDALERTLFAAPRRPPARRPKPAPPPAPPTTRVCVARATGGEVKCWDDFTGLAFSPESTHVLLKRGRALYVGKIAGVRPDPPVKIIDDADGAATWTTGPVAAPLAPAASARH